VAAATAKTARATAVRGSLTAGWRTRGSEARLTI
jgi:hypothetical protein